ncbi:PEP-CTERM sorting domain-containing protein [Thalassotalea piscium]
MKSKYLSLTAAAALLAMSSFANTANASLLLDRGLPTDNLNNASGDNRSNVSWEWGDVNTFAGDTFTVSGTDSWKVDTITTWVTGSKEQNFWLGDKYGSLELFFGEFGSDLTQLLTGNFVENTNTTDNSNITITKVNYANGDLYQGSSGSMISLYQIDWAVDLTLEAGKEYAFGADGQGRNDEQFWFNLASNAALSGSPQEGADDLVHAWENGSYLGSWDTNSSSLAGTAYNGGWDKSSDINVQLHGSVDVPEPSTLAIFALALVGLGSRRFNKK